MASPVAAALLFLVLGTNLACCKEPTLQRSPLIRQARDVPTTGCYIVVMQDDASEDELQQMAARVVEASDDARLYGLVHRVKKAFTVKLNPYALEMVSWGGDGRAYHSIERLGEVGVKKRMCSLSGI